MASEFKSRITGKVVHTEKQEFGSGERAFRFLEVHVQTGPATIVPVRFTDRWPSDTPRSGDLLDLEVTVSGYTGRNGLDLSATANRFFDESYVLELQTAAA
jgi:hypothetical protein